jgi:Lrp/AsnC family leucine-responsive transcriptional regulator
MKSAPSVDRTDALILGELARDARLSMRELSARVNLSAPAVGERVRRLEEAGVITGYHAAFDLTLVAPRVRAFVNTTMKSADHRSFLAFAEGEDAVREIHRISGDSCYLLCVETADHAELERLLERILDYANYRVNITLSSNAKKSPPIVPLS